LTAVSEILENQSLASLHSTVDLMMTRLRLVAKFDLDSDDHGQNSLQYVRRIIHIFSKPTFRKLVNVPKEILLLIRYKAGSAKSGSMFDPKALEFIQFLTEEVMPDDLLQALIIAETSPIYRPELLPILCRVVARGMLLGSELSASLLRIKRARQRLEQSKDSLIINNELLSTRGIWARLAEGTLAIEK
jgi:hypothetical protein